MTQDYVALYDTKVQDNFKNFLTKQDFVNFFTFMDTDGPTDEYKSVITNLYNSTLRDKDERKQAITLIKKGLKGLGLRRLDTRLNQDGVKYEDYKALFSQIVNDVFDDKMVKCFYFLITNPHIMLAGFEAISSGKEIFPPFGTT